MPRCPYRLSPRVDPTRPRCLLNEDHAGEHVIDPAAPRTRGRTPGEPTAIVSLRLPVAVVQAWEVAPPVRREKARAAFVRALRK